MARQFDGYKEVSVISVPTEPAPEGERREWTVLLYFAGDNDLAEDMIQALHRVDKLRLESLINLFQSSGVNPPQKPMNQMIDDIEKILNDVAIIVQFDPSGVGVPTERYHVSETLRQMWDQKIEAHKQGKQPVGGSVFDNFETVRPLSGSDTNTGAAHTLRSFIEWGFGHYPAENTALILSGHGSGAVADFLAADASSGDSLTNEELAEALLGVKKALTTTRSSKKKIDVIGMDACMMSMGEVMLAVQPFADFFVGAEGFEPQSGWPYQQLLENLLPRADEITPEDVAKGIVSIYVDYYRSLTELTEWSVDMAACELNKLDPVKEEVNKLAEQLLPHFDTPNHQLQPSDIKKRIQDKVILAHWRAQSYKEEDYVDLKDFCILLQKELEDLAKPWPLWFWGSARHPVADAIFQVCDDLIKAINDLVKLSCFGGPAYQHSYGLSLYFPWSWIAPGYDVRASSLGIGKWATFLESYVDNTRREMRGCPDALADSRVEHVAVLDEALTDLRRKVDQVLGGIEEWSQRDLSQEQIAELHEMIHSRVETVGRDEALQEALRIFGRRLEEGWVSSHMKGNPVERQWVEELKDRLGRESARLHEIQIGQAHAGTFLIAPEHMEGINDRLATEGRENFRYTHRVSRYTHRVSRYTHRVSRFTGMGGCTMKNPPLESPRCGCPPSPPANRDSQGE